MVIQPERYFRQDTVFFSVSLGGVRLRLLGTSATVGLLYQPRLIDDDYGAVGGMRIGRGNRSTRRKPVPVPFCPPQIPHDLTWDQTRAAAVGNLRLTSWAMARPRQGTIPVYTRKKWGEPWTSQDSLSWYPVIRHDTVQCKLGNRSDLK
jgi:hypothetical protein